MVVNTETFDEYRTRILRRSIDNRHFDIKNSWGSKYIYRSVSKGHIFKQFDEATLSAIIRGINDILVDDIAKGIPVSLPHIGTFYVTMKESFYYKKDGKLHTNRGIDWEATHKLWYEDKEAEKKKILLRNKCNTIYHITWDRGVFNNCTFYKFRAHRGLKAKLKDNIRNNIGILTYL